MFLKTQRQLVLVLRTMQIFYIITSALQRYERDDADMFMLYDPSYLCFFVKHGFYNILLLTAHSRHCTIEITHHKTKVKLEERTQICQPGEKSK